MHDDHAFEASTVSRTSDGCRRESVSAFPAWASIRHGAASLGTAAARCGAGLAVLMAKFLALLRAPTANVGTERADLVHEGALRSHSTNCLLTDLDTFDAASWAIGIALLPNHRVKTVATGNHASLTSFDARTEGGGAHVRLLSNHGDFGK